MGGDSCPPSWRRDAPALGVGATGLCAGPSPKYWEPGSAFIGAHTKLSGTVLPHLASTVCQGSCASDAPCMKGRQKTAAGGYVE